jgi:hypothetical protein
MENTKDETDRSRTVRIEEALRVMRGLDESEREVVAMELFVDALREEARRVDSKVTMTTEQALARLDKLAARLRVY